MNLTKNLLNIGIILSTFLCGSMAFAQADQAMIDAINQVYGGSNTSPVEIEIPEQPQQTVQESTQFPMPATPTENTTTPYSEPVQAQQGQRGISPTPATQEGITFAAPQGITPVEQPLTELQAIELIPDPDLVIQPSEFNTRTGEVTKYTKNVSAIRRAMNFLSLGLAKNSAYCTSQGLKFIITNTLDKPYSLIFAGPNTAIEPMGPRSDGSKTYSSAYTPSTHTVVQPGASIEVPLWGTEETCQKYGRSEHVIAKWQEVNGQNIKDVGSITVGDLASMNANKIAAESGILGRNGAQYDIKRETFAEVFNRQRASENNRLSDQTLAVTTAQAIGSPNLGVELNTAGTFLQANLSGRQIQPSQSLSSLGVGTLDLDQIYNENVLGVPTGNMTNNEYTAELQDFVTEIRN